MLEVVSDRAEELDGVIHTTRQATIGTKDDEDLHRSDGLEVERSRDMERSLHALEGLLAQRVYHVQIRSNRTTEAAIYIQKLPSSPASDSLGLQLFTTTAPHAPPSAPQIHAPHFPAPGDTHSQTPRSDTGALRGVLQARRV
ncbi:MAG: hypothetical protein Q9160_003284 [Pyrenula sp. 1 TL-2023]